MRYKKLHPDALTPAFMTPGAAGFDLACLKYFQLKPFEARAIPTGLAFELPVGYELQIRPRSGFFVSSRLRVVLGTVDSDYRGEVHILCENIGSSGIAFAAGTRIAQAVLAQVEHCTFEEAAELSPTLRAARGFGSTGV